MEWPQVWLINDRLGQQGREVTGCIRRGEDKRRPEQRSGFDLLRSPHATLSAICEMVASLGWRSFPDCCDWKPNFRRQSKALCCLSTQDKRNVNDDGWIQEMWCIYEWSFNRGVRMKIVCRAWRLECE